MDNFEKIRSILPNRIRIYRNSRGWTQERLAEEIDIHATYISRIESGKKLPTLITICKIGDALGIDVYELLMEEAKIASSDYQKKRLVNIVSESKPAELNIYSAFIHTLRKRDKKG